MTAKLNLFVVPSTANVTPTANNTVTVSVPGDLVTVSYQEVLDRKVRFVVSNPNTSIPVELCLQQQFDAGLACPARTQTSFEVTLPLQSAPYRLQIGAGRLGTLAKLVNLPLTTTSCKHKHEHKHKHKHKRARCTKITTCRK